MPNSPDNEKPFLVDAETPAMIDLFSLFIGIVVFNFIWNTDAPFASKLCVSDDGFIIRTKYPADYRLDDPREKIDAFALRLVRSDRVDRYLRR
jgi:hypothetical protein